MPDELKAGVYTSTKGNTVVVAEDGRNLYALYNDGEFGVRTKWPMRFPTYKEFVDSQKMVREKDFGGAFF